MSALAVLACLGIAVVPDDRADRHPDRPRPPLALAGIRPLVLRSTAADAIGSLSSPPDEPTLAGRRSVRLVYPALIAAR